MLTEFARLDQDHIVFLTAALGILCSFFAFVIALVSIQWRKFRERELELAFKHDMLERGLSMNEIERLIHARPHGLIVRTLQAVGAVLEALLAACRRAFASLAISFQSGKVRRERDTFAFQERLLRQGLSVDEIERLLNAPKPQPFVDALWRVLSDCAAALVRIASRCLALLSRFLQSALPRCMDAVKAMLAECAEAVRTAGRTVP